MRRRRRQDVLRKSASSSTSGTGVGSRPPTTVTPFNLTLAGVAPLEAGSPIGTTGDGRFSTSVPALSPAQNAASFPAGLTSKELARLRSVPMLSPTSHPQSGSQSTYLPTISISDQSTVTPTPDTQRLQTEVETLRREMQELRAATFEAPPSYGDGGGV